MTEVQERKERPRGRRWRRWLIDGILLVAIVSAVSLWQGRNLIEAGEIAPDFAFQNLEGETVRLSDLRGRRVVLYFWAPWCGVCKAVAPNVRWLSSLDGVEVLRIAASYGDPAKVRESTPEELNASTLLGDDGVVESYAIRAYPTFYVVGADGRIERSFLGYTTRAGLWLRSLL